MTKHADTLQTKHSASDQNALSTPLEYTIQPVMQDNELRDLRIERQGRVSHWGGRHGIAQELKRSDDIPRDGSVLPVFVGLGLGHGLQALLAEYAGPVAVIDREKSMHELTRTRMAWAHDRRVLWLDGEARDVLQSLSNWQMEHGGLPFFPLVDPCHVRLDPEYYRALADQLAVSQSVDFWSQARHPKFTQTIPRILLLTSTYFLTGELKAACDRLGYVTQLLQLPSKEIGTQEFVESILTEVIAFKPDFVLTINHLGVDKEGVLTGLLEQLQLPLASWFVDNPHLILYVYENLNSPWVSIFTWDEDNITSLRSRGFGQVHYLPLATDPHRFVPPRQTSFSHDIAFVGNSMVHKVQAKYDNYAFPDALIQAVETIATDFERSGELSVSAFLDTRYPEHARRFRALPDVDYQLAFETLITWQATLKYRLDRVRQLLPFTPLVAGDSGWFSLLPEKGWSYHKELSYYSELPHFYPRIKINFNCTSQQMKGAVNQRVFDVPACGGFILTDYRRQMDQLFDVGTEVICYDDPLEIPELVRFYLRHDTVRQQVAQAARRCVLARHTYDLRLRSLVETMRQSYA